MAICYPKDEKVYYPGAVLETGEMNYHDDSDFYAVVWTGEKVIRVEYDTTRYAGGGSATVDATPEVRAAAAAWLREAWFQRWASWNRDQARVPDLGRRVRLIKGRPVKKGTKDRLPLGTEGVVFYKEERRSQYGTWSHGYRYGIALTDRMEPGYTLAEEEETVTLSAPYRDRFPHVARGLGGKWDRDRKLWIFPLSSKDAVGEEAEQWFPGRHLDVCFTAETNVEVVDPENYEFPDEVGRKIASERDTAFRAFTHPPSSSMVFM